MGKTPLVRLAVLCVGLYAFCAATGVGCSCSSENTSMHATDLMNVGGKGTANVDVLTQHNNPQRTGAISGETLLTPSTVNNTNFGELWQLPVDGQVDAQPLYVSNYITTGQTQAKNVLIVATLNNTIYAFDADSNNVNPLWAVYYGAPYAGGITNNKPTGQNPPYMGILSTPVIDRTRATSAPQPGVIYFVMMTSTQHFFIYSASLYDGRIVAGPTDITQALGAGFNTNDQLQRPGLLLASGYVYVAFGGSSDERPGTNWHGWVTRFDAATLTLVGTPYQTTSPGSGGGIWQAGAGLAADGSGNIYFTTGNGAYDWGCCTPNANGSGYTPSPDNCALPIYISGGKCFNNTSTPPPTQPVKEEDSIVKLSSTLSKIGSYSPWGANDQPGHCSIHTATACMVDSQCPLPEACLNAHFGQDFQAMEACDADFGSSGPVLFTQGSLSRLVTGGKAGQLFVLDPTLMSGSEGPTGPSPLTQGVFQATTNSHISDPLCYDKSFTYGPHIHGSPAFLHGASSDYLFVWGEKDYPRRFTVSSGSVSSGSVTPAGLYSSNYTDSTPPSGMPGGAVSVSWDGVNDSSAILWALAPSKGSCGSDPDCDTSKGGAQGIVTGDLYAFRVSDMSLLWSTRNFHTTRSPDRSVGAGLSRPIRDYSKFVPPTIANGKVFVATSGFSVIVYGIRTLGGGARSSSTFADCNGALNTYSADVDGDGVNDLVCQIYTDSTHIKIAVQYGANNSSAFPRGSWTSAAQNWCYVANPSDPTSWTSHMYVGDFDGDRRADLLCHSFSDGQDYILWNSGDPTQPYKFTTPYYWDSLNYPGWGTNWCDSNYTLPMGQTKHYGLDEELVIGDFNGDGRSDLLCHNKVDPAQHVRVRLGQVAYDSCNSYEYEPFGCSGCGCSPGGCGSGSCVSGSNPFVDVGFSWCYNNGQVTAGSCGYRWDVSLLAGDIDGDGLDDLLCHRPSDGYKWVAYSQFNRQTGTGSLFTGTNWQYPMGWCSDFDSYGDYVDQFRLADLDGDGADDMICHNMSSYNASTNPNGGRSYVMYSHPRKRGSLNVCNTTSTPAPYNCPSNVSCSYDHTPGSDDCSPTSSPWCWGWVSTGCTYPVSQFFPVLLNADMDGDNRADFVCHDTTDTTDWFSYHPETWSSH